MRDRRDALGVIAGGPTAASTKPVPWRAHVDLGRRGREDVHWARRAARIGLVAAGAAAILLATTRAAARPRAGRREAVAR